ncbi:MAG: hypothetical protein Q8K32_09320 [Archangium sp.]|nr:hypothetical protein [Archangium sp.]
MSVLTEWLGALTDGIAANVAEGSQAKIDAENRKRIQLAIAGERRARVLTLEAGGRQAGEARIRGSQLQGSQRVAIAANNLDASSGTAADLQASSAIFSEMDAATAQNNARAAALGHDAVLQRYDDAYKDIDRKKDERIAGYAAQFGKRAVAFTSSALGGAGGE